LTRRFTGGRLVIASHNKGKVREIGDLLRPFNVEAVSAGDLGLPEPDETGTTYIENAELKARAASSAANLPALADDSGFGVRVLNGDPGLYSARWAGPSKDFTFAMRTVWEKMQATGNPDRHGEFVCALSLAWPDGHCESFEGRLPGMVIWPPRGDKGFGYDPMFVAEGHTLSFGEMEAEAKHAISHRAIAFNQLIRACFGG
jgi:XTP/dITP diphosphohydrolase